MINKQKLLEPFNAVKFQWIKKKTAGKKFGVSLSTLIQQLVNYDKK